MSSTPENESTSLLTLQWGWGGLADFEPVKGVYNICLITGTWTGPYTLCGREPYAKDAPGWSKGGGVSGPDVNLAPCRNCAQAAAIIYPELPICGLRDHVDSFVALGLGLVAGRR